MDRFQSDILDQIAKGNDAQPKCEPPKINRLTLAKCRPSRGCCSDKKKKENTKNSNSAISKHNHDHNNKKANNNDHGSSSSSSSDDDDNNEDHNAKNEALEWLEHRAKQPFRYYLFLNKNSVKLMHNIAGEIAKYPLEDVLFWSNLNP